MFVNMKTAQLRNAIFLEKPNNSHVNTLTLIFNADKLGDPNALTIAIHNIHPTLGRHIERNLKTTSRLGIPDKP